MAINYVKELADKRQSSINLKGETNYTRVWLVTTDNKLDGSMLVRQAVTVQRGDIYDTSDEGGNESDSTAVCLTKTAACIDKGGCHWHVTVTYGPRSKARTPLEQIPRISIGTQGQPKNMDYDRFNQAVLNAAYDPYSEPLQKIQHYTTFSVSVNVAYSDFTWNHVRDYSGTINSNSFLGAAPGTLMVTVTASNAESDEVEGGVYWTVNYHFEYMPKGHDPQVLNAGYNQIEEGKKKPIKLANGQDPATPQLLDRNGKLLGEGETPLFKKHELYERVPFNFSW